MNEIQYTQRKVTFPKKNPLITLFLYIKHTD